MDKYIELLKKKGIVDRLQRSINNVPKPTGMSDEEYQKKQTDFIASKILSETDNDNELFAEWVDASCDMFLDAVIERLDIKKESNGMMFEDFLDKILDSIGKAIESDSLEIKVCCERESEGK